VLEPRHPQIDHQRFELSKTYAKISINTTELSLNPTFNKQKRDSNPNHHTIFSPKTSSSRHISPVNCSINHAHLLVSYCCISHSKPVQFHIDEAVFRLDIHAIRLEIRRDFHALVKVAELIFNAVLDANR
jgi:hypothetical protein